jgi:NADH-ubiquinone oxidoreductase chain 3
MVLFIIYLLSLFTILLLLALTFFLSEGGNIQLSTREESSSFECGFEHNSLSRLPFSLRYFLLTVVFLVFDMEVIFLAFIPVSFFFNASLIFSTFIIVLFLLLLLVGLFYEWVDGSLDWVI